ncbi:uncharacterized protein N7482_007480 [Penicillium canariense]|uniref:Uncharacterized protein n=1 Tax=Penicillium canariense TaxID=189055 RepID=A0A9W9HZI5_9EURO|nr:uncharacterized protein N7482_007480 [Penicillium canariense]KAJ5160476.1 hypothetical protein N7482_007480 [Penicillium canariense]
MPAITAKAVADGLVESPKGEVGESKGLGRSGWAQTTPHSRHLRGLHPLACLACLVRSLAVYFGVCFTHGGFPVDRDVLPLFAMPIMRTGASTALLFYYPPSQPVSMVESRASHAAKSTWDFPQSFHIQAYPHWQASPLCHYFTIMIMITNTTSLPQSAFSTMSITALAGAHPVAIGVKIVRESHFPAPALAEPTPPPS